MRTRTRDNIPTIPCSLKTIRHVPAAPTTVEVLPDQLSGFCESQTMTDVVTPRFKTQRAQGAIIMNPATSQKDAAWFPQAEYLVRYRKYRLPSETLDEAFEYAGETPFTLSTWMPTERIFLNPPGFSAAMNALSDPVVGAERRTLNTAHARAAESDVLALVTLAEAKKSLKSVTDLTVMLAKFMDPLEHPSVQKRPRIKTRKQLAQFGLKAASRWLEYRYGIMPLLYELDSYWSLLNGSGKKKRVRFVARETGQTVGPPVSTVTSTTQYYIESKGSRHGRRDTVVSGVIVEPTPLDTMRNAFGMDRLATSAWELVPFSFIVDWVFDTANLIAAHEGRIGQRVCGSWTTRTTILNGSYWLTTDFRTTTDASYRYVGSGNRTYTMTNESTRVVREANPNLSALPNLDLRLNKAKIADLIAIAATMKYRVKRS